MSDPASPSSPVPVAVERTKDHEDHHARVEPLKAGVVGQDLAQSGNEAVVTAAEWTERREEIRHAMKVGFMEGVKAARAGDAPYRLWEDSAIRQNFDYEHRSPDGDGQGTKRTQHGDSADGRQGQGYERESGVVVAATPTANLAPEPNLSMAITDESADGSEPSDAHSNPPSSPVGAPTPTTESDRLLSIAGLVNAYHNDATTLSAAETLRAVADCLGDPFTTEESGVDEQHGKPKYRIPMPPAVSYCAQCNHRRGAHHGERCVYGCECSGFVATSALGGSGRRADDPPETTDEDKS